MKAIVMTDKKTNQPWVYFIEDQEALKLNMVRIYTPMHGEEMISRNRLETMKHESMKVELRKRSHYLSNISKEIPHLFENKLAGYEIRLKQVAIPLGKDADEADMHIEIAALPEFIRAVNNKNILQEFSQIKDVFQLYFPQNTKRGSEYIESQLFILCKTNFQ